MNPKITRRAILTAAPATALAAAVPMLARVEGMPRESLEECLDLGWSSFGSWLARLDGYPPYDCAELLLTRALVESGMSRIDFLGRDQGLWGVHPPYRSELFYEQLPSLIERIEAGDVTEAQRGNHDVDDSMIEGQREVDAFRNRNAATSGDNPLMLTPDGEDARLPRVDDRLESVSAATAEVGN